MSCLRLSEDPRRFPPVLSHQPLALSHQPLAISHSYPPPTKFTISTSSPACTSVVLKLSRLSTIRLCSTATRRESMSSWARRSTTVNGPASSWASPFKVIRNLQLILVGFVSRCRDGLRPLGRRGVVSPESRALARPLRPAGRRGV